MLNSWVLYVVIYLVAMTIFTQFYKIATKSLTKVGALTVLIQLIGAITGIILCPFFKMKFPTEPIVYVLLGISVICYAVKDRLDTKVMSGIEASTFNILQQLSTTFMIFAGLLFFKEEFVITKFIGAMLIIISNVFIFYQKGQFKLDKYVGLGIIANLVFTVALFLDVNISGNFNLAFYSVITLGVPAILITIFERIKLSEIKQEFINGNKPAILSTGIAFTASIISQLTAYQLGNVTIVAPLCALTVIINVIIGYLFLNEKDNLVKKIISAILIIISVILIKG